MKKFLLSAGASLIPLLGIAQGASAAGNALIDCGNSQFSRLCGLTGSNFGNYLGQIITFVFILAIVIALAFLIWGGIKWVTSGGEKGGVEEARNHVIAAVVGLIIVFLSYFILNLIVYAFTGNSLSQITIPTLNPQP